MRHRVVLLLLCLCLLPLGSAAALDEQTAVLRAARLAPAEADVFFAIRTDDAYVTTLQGLVDRVWSALPARLQIPAVDFRQELRNALVGTPFTYEQLRGLLGDTVSFSLRDAAPLMTDDSSAAASAAGLLIAVDITDRPAMVQLLNAIASAAGDTPPTLTRTVNDIDLYEDVPGTIIGIGPQTLYFATGADALPVPGQDTLATAPEFVQAMNGLPAARYNILAYVDIEAIARASLVAGGVPADTPLIPGFTLDMLGSMSMGFTILEDRSLVIDIVQTTVLNAAQEAAYVPVNPALLRRIPAGMDALIQVAGVAASLRAALAPLSELAQQANQPDPAEQIAMLFRAIGLDFERDILAGISGDIVLFSGVDFAPLLSAATGGLPPGVPLEFGLLVETNSPATAEHLATRLATTLRGVAGTAPEVRFGTATLNGAAVTSIRLDLSASGINNPYNLVLGWQDSLLFFASAEAAAFITGGLNTPPLAADPVYVAAARHLLPGATQVLYTNDEGLLLSTLIPLALLGPAIGGIFDDIVDDLQQTGTPAHRRIQMNDPLAEARELLAVFNNIVASSSISTARVDDLIVSRLVLSLE
ncbi:MAG: DUF3352 domain-containing protein [Anaerolineae bacterium]|nr:DUF3352 domain-containing protein [Anaerolineae bacterium]